MYLSRCRGCREWESPLTFFWGRWSVSLLRLDARSNGAGFQNVIPRCANVVAECFEVYAKDFSIPLADLAVDEDRRDVAGVGTQHNRADGIVEWHIVEVFSGEDEHIGLLAGGERRRRAR